MLTNLNSVWYEIFSNAYTYCTNYLLFVVSILIASVMCLWIYEKPRFYKVGKVFLLDAEKCVTQTCSSRGSERLCEILLPGNSALKTCGVPIINVCRQGMGILLDCFHATSTYCAAVPSFQHD